LHADVAGKALLGFLQSHELEVHSLGIHAGQYLGLEHVGHAPGLVILGNLKPSFGGEVAEIPRLEFFVLAALVAIGLLSS